MATDIGPVIEAKFRAVGAQDVEKAATYVTDDIELDAIGHSIHRLNHRRPKE